MRKEDVGFHVGVNETKEKETNLDSCFDSWKPPQKKGKHPEQMEVDVAPIKEQHQKNSTKIMEHKNGSAVLVPDEYEKVDEIWGKSSEEESDNEDDDVVAIPEKSECYSVAVRRARQLTYYFYCFSYNLSEIEKNIEQTTKY